jgi:hypothetical protein
VSWRRDVAVSEQSDVSDLVAEFESKFDIDGAAGASFVLMDSNSETSIGSTSRANVQKIVVASFLENESIDAPGVNRDNR